MVRLATSAVPSDGRPERGAALGAPSRRRFGGRQRSPTASPGEDTIGRLTSESAAPGDRILPATRTLAAVIVPFLVVAFAVLVPEPSDTGRLFAWNLTPSLSAMILGSVYLGGAYYFVQVVRASRWHTVAGGFVPVGTFASLMGIATVAHWNRFSHSHVAFWLWAGLYFTTPVLVFAAFWRNQREFRPATGTPSDGLHLAPGAAVAITVAGGASVAMSALLFLWPRGAIDAWPWALTPLTARMLGAIFALGLAGLFAHRERRWSAVRTLVQVALVMLVLIVACTVRARHELDPGNVLTWLFTAGFLTTTVAMTRLYLEMERRDSADPAPNPLPRPDVA
jgi:hypothetical protein